MIATFLATARCGFSRRRDIRPGTASCRCTCQIPPRCWSPDVVPQGGVDAGDVDRGFRLHHGRRRLRLIPAVEQQPENAGLHAARCTSFERQYARLTGDIEAERRRIRCAPADDFGRHRSAAREACQHREIVRSRARLSGRPSLDSTFTCGNCVAAIADKSANPPRTVIARSNVCAPWIAGSVTPFSACSAKAMARSTSGPNAIVVDRMRAFNTRPMAPDVTRSRARRAAGLARNWRPMAAIDPHFVIGSNTLGDCGPDNGNTYTITALSANGHMLAYGPYDCSVPEAPFVWDVKNGARPYTIRASHNWYPIEINDSAQLLAAYMDGSKRTHWGIMNRAVSDSLKRAK